MTLKDIVSITFLAFFIVLVLLDKLTGKTKVKSNER